MTAFRTSVVPNDPVGFMGGLFGTGGHHFNRSGVILEHPNAHQFDFYIAFPNTLTLIHCFGFPSMLGPITGAMESIIMSQFSFKVSGTPSMLRPISVVSFPDSIPSGLQGGAALGGAVAQTRSVADAPPLSRSGVVPTVAFAADAANIYGGLSFTHAPVNMLALASFYYPTPAGSYILRLVYPGEYEVWSDITTYSGTGDFVIGSIASQAGWPSIDIGGYVDNFTKFREIMGSPGGARKGGWYAILYRCDWLDE